MYVPTYVLIIFTVACFLMALGGETPRKGGR